MRGHEENRAALRLQKDIEDLIVPPVVVNEPLRWGAVLSPSLASVLPPLPAELAFRLVGRDLVLIDVESDLVVDVIRAAIRL